MRRILLAFFISLFFLSGLFGFGVVRQVRAIAESEPAPQTPATQINLILVHVDDTRLDRPCLTSIWGVFISRSIVPGLIMKRIYPEAGSPASAKLGAAFSLDENKQLDRKFLAVMHDLALPAAEIVVVDDDGLAAIAAVLSHQALPVSASMYPGNAQDKELKVFQEICTLINTPANAAQLIAPELLPLASANGIDSTFGFLNKWKGLVTSLHFASCEVLAGP